MPRPLYIVCAESGAEDRRTNKFSIFNILEKLSLHRPVVQANTAVILPSLQFRLVIGWMRVDGDGVDFDSQISIIRPDGEREIIADISFSFEDGKLNTRIIVEMPGLPDIGEIGGVVLFESRLRPTGASEWTVAQDYPIIVEFGEPPAIPA